MTLESGASLPAPSATLADTFVVTGGERVEAFAKSATGLSWVQLPREDLLSADDPVADGGTYRELRSFFGAGDGGGQAPPQTFSFSNLTTWSANHSRGAYPDVVLIDAAGRQMIGSITYPSATQVVATFNTPTTGVMRID